MGYGYSVYMRYGDFYATLDGRIVTAREDGTIPLHARLVATVPHPHDARLLARLLADANEGAARRVKRQRK